MVRQALGNGKPAKSSRVNSIPLERQFSEEGERKEGKEDEEEEEEKGEKNNNSHTHTHPRVLLLLLPQRLLGCV